VFRVYAGQTEIVESISGGTDLGDLRGDGYVIAKMIQVDTSALDGILSGADADIQAALETIDGHVHASLYAALMHASRHLSGGSDAIKLDDLAAPDDTTDLNVSISRHGLLPKLSGVGTDYFGGDGLYHTVPTGGSGTGSGDVSGPASAVDGNIAVFDGPTGKIIRDGGSLRMKNKLFENSNLI
jgi:hypothetical protein